MGIHWLDVEICCCHLRLLRQYLQQHHQTLPVRWIWMHLLILSLNKMPQVVIPKKIKKCIKPMTQDEGLCKYGQSGQARKEACERYKGSGGKLPSAASQGKSLGGAYAM